jgi:hypothetical protein
LEFSVNRQGSLPADPLFAVAGLAHNGIMERPTLQISLAGMLLLVACIAVNFWLFRLGVFWGILGLNVTKHVLIAYLCEVVGVDRRRPAQPAPILSVRAPQIPSS